MLGTGPVFENGQVVCYNWYEVGADEGIQITVAKNLTTAYSIWWFAKSVSTLNYEFTTVPDFFGQQYEYLDSSVSASELADEAVENACYALWTTDLEDDCLGEESNTSHGVTQELLIAILVFVCLILVSLIAFGLFGLIQLNKRLPLARAETTNNPITAVNATL